MFFENRCKTSFAGKTNFSIVFEYGGVPIVSYRHNVDLNKSSCLFSLWNSGTNTAITNTLFWESVYFICGWYQFFERFSVWRCPVCILWTWCRSKQKWLLLSLWKVQINTVMTHTRVFWKSLDTYHLRAKQIFRTF